MRLRDVAVVLTLAGCGQVADNKNSPDAAPDAPDTTAPMIVDSHPLKDAKAVSVIAPISLYLDEAADPASVSTTTVKLRYVTKGNAAEYMILGTQPFDNVNGNVWATVTWVPESRKIQIVPSLPLPYNAHVEVTVDGVKDKYGNALAATKLAFDTAVNAPRMRQDYYNSTGGLAYYYDFTLMNGMPSNYLYSYAPGTDGLWYTSDDTRGSHRTAVYDSNGRMSLFHLFNGGSDGVYNTPDDVETRVDSYNWDSQGRLSYYQLSTNAGTDTLWGTADDIPSQRIVLTYQGDNLITQVTLTAPGLDGMWGTADDLMSSPSAQFFKYQYDSNNHRTRQIYYQAGTDKIPGTNDDVVATYYDITTDSHGLVTRTVQRLAGPNGLWFDGDDAVSNYTDTIRDMNGRQTETKYYNTAGANGTWLDSDDHQAAHTTDTLNAAGQVTDETQWNAGANGIFGDSDDMPSTYYLTTYDASGARLTWAFFAGPGPNNTWKDGDDYLYYRWPYDTNH